MHDEFIKRSQELFKDKVKAAALHRSANQWSKKNPEKHKKLRKKYERSPKGKAAASISQVRHRHQNIEITLSVEEKLEIGKFYLNCPPGYDVDHIVPLSRGGKHELSNLQYLTRSENMSKGPRTMEEHILRKKLIARNLKELQTDMEKITSKQMLSMTNKELSSYLPFLLKKIYDRSSINASNLPKPAQSLI